MEGGKGYSGGQEKDWMGRPNENLKDLGIKSGGWRKTVQKAVSWFRLVEDGALAFMRKQHVMS